MENIKKSHIVFIIIFIVLMAAVVITSKKTSPSTEEVKPSLNITWQETETIDDLIDLHADVSSLKNVLNSEYYVQDKDSIYWIFPYSRKVEGADVPTFRIWDKGGTIAVDRAHVYLTGVMVPNADPKTFSTVGENQYVNHLYYRDIDSVFIKEAINVRGDYLYGLKEIPGADPATIRSISEKIIVDNKHVYFNGKEVLGLDGNTFKVIEEPYFSDKSGVHFFNEYLNTYTLSFAPVSVVNVLTKDSTNGGYIVAGNLVFIGTTTIPGAHADTFRIFAAESASGEQHQALCTYRDNCPYAADEKSVYYLGKKIIGADSKTFTPIGYDLLSKFGGDRSMHQPKYATDAKRVYYDDEVVSGADPSTFIPLISGNYYFEYGRDSSAVYWKAKVIEGADPATFSIFEGQQPYEGCSAGRYSKDAVSVYYQNKRIVGADPKSFKMLYGAGAYGEDATHFYKEGSPAKREEFRECEYG